MKLLLFVALLGCAVVSSFATEWEEWKMANEKAYAEEEEYKRQMIWQQNLQVVTKHNYEYDLGLHTFRMGMNQFADMTIEEFTALFLGERRSESAEMCMRNQTFDTHDLPEMVDWAKKGYVTPVKDQRKCGSCWAFSATGSLEGQHFKKTGDLVSLSEQNLIDCSTAEGDHGCSGGLMDDAFAYIKENGGIDTESSYPYMAVKGECHYTKKNMGATLTGCVDLPAEDEMSLKSAVAKIGPISVAIDAGHQSFQLYESGIYYEPSCSQVKLDHGVLAVGYGTENGEAYWLVKNSWGKTWGKLGGYIHMSRNRNNNCGIASKASYPVV